MRRWNAWPACAGIERLLGGAGYFGAGYFRTDKERFVAMAA